jgi:DNA polymerase-1
MMTHQPGKLILSLASSDQEFEQYLTYASKAPILAVDTEANGEDVRDTRGQCMGISTAFRGTDGTLFGAYMPFKHEDYNWSDRRLSAFKDVLQGHPCIVAHNVKFDIVSLSTLGIKVKNNFYCTMLMAHLLNENEFNYSLDALTKKYLNDEGKRTSENFLALKEELGWAGIPAAVMFDYSVYDAELHLRLFEYLMPLFMKEGLIEYWDKFEKPFIETIILMESRGILIDEKVVITEWMRGSKIKTEIVERLGRNPGSPIELEKMLIDELGLERGKLTKSGKLSFNKEAMQGYDEQLAKMDNYLAKEIFTFRGWQKTLSSNYQAYMKYRSPDERLRCNYKLHGTKTGRLSCEEPNLQQIPRESTNDWNGNLKAAFIPAPGYRLYEADFGQLELRLASAYANERGLLAVFEQGRDIFTEMSEGIGMSRQDTKTLTYTIQYGGGITRISSVFRVTPERAASIRQNFYSTYPGFRKITELASNKCKSVGQIRLWSGRYRHFEDRRGDSHKAFNSVIQGGAADIVKMVMNRLRMELDNDTECRMLLQVHDSVVFEIREDCVADYLPKIETLMTDLPEFGVRFAVDIHEWGSK